MVNMCLVDVYVEELFLIRWVLVLSDCGVFISFRVWFFTFRVNKCVRKSLLVSETFLTCCWWINKPESRKSTASVTDSLQDDATNTRASERTNTARESWRRFPPRRKLRLLMLEFGFRFVFFLNVQTCFWTQGRLFLTVWILFPER